MQSLEPVLDAAYAATSPQSKPEGTIPAIATSWKAIRLKLWEHLDETQRRCGNTFTVPESPWLNLLNHEEPLLEVQYPGLQHFVITTEDDVVEVLSPEPAEIECLGSAPEDSAIPGKSEVFYYPEDGLDLKDILGKKN